MPYYIQARIPFNVADNMFGKKKKNYFGFGVRQIYADRDSSVAQRIRALSEFRDFNL